jgi:hypothetical protein
MLRKNKYMTKHASFVTENYDGTKNSKMESYGTNKRYGARRKFMVYSTQNVTVSTRPKLR